MPRLRFAFLIALLVSASAASAQGRTGRVRGMVVDSLLGAPLPGAEVRLVQGNRRSVTDSTGRFVLDSVAPGEWSVAFRHPSLDSLGITTPAVPVRVFAGATSTVTLATPAFEEYRDRWCADTPDSLTSTVAYGGVFSRNQARVRVVVSVSWMLGSATGSASRPGTVRTIVDGDRTIWIACGIPSGAWIHATVVDSTHRLSAYMHMGPRGIAVRDLVVADGVAPLSGVVTDSEGRVVRGARVSVVETPVTSQTDATGGFVLRDAPDGTITLDVRAAGYRPWVETVTAASERFAIVLQPLPEVSSDIPSGSDYLRLLQRSARDGVQLLIGDALSGESAALETLPPAGTCHWWLDGRPVSREFFVAQPHWTWRALELYPRGADAPPEFGSTGCPVALLWTSAADW
ncbi:MAG: carboxypeptidase regulatory-like domain-containing protein [Gemmatimonadetes bacterium]|nr:carboxypeptidase regulatory-like domain-containing protein [Gemmatimonadota bacterium]